MSPQLATPWFRFYSEVLSDRKIQRISKTLKQPMALIVGVWATILALANDSPRRGKLLITEGVPVTIEEISAICGLSENECRVILQAFTEMKMLYLDENSTYTVTQWDNRQFTSDNSTERVRRHRERKKEEGGDEQEKDDYTKRYRNVSVTPSESESESESDIINSGPLAQALLGVCKQKRSYVERNPGMCKSLKDTLRFLIEEKAQPADLPDFEKWRKTYHWSAREGPSPTFKQVAELWGTYQEWVNQGRPNITNGPKGQSTNGHKTRQANPDPAATEYQGEQESTLRGVSKGLAEALKARSRGSSSGT